jgi:hypothetical protein
MNGKQKMVVFAGCVILTATGLYPPWVQSWKFVGGGEDMVLRIEPGSEGYSWIFRPPGAPSWVNRNLRTLEDEGFLGSSSEENGMPEATRKLALKSATFHGPWRAEIDIWRLLAEWLMIVACAFAGVVCFASNKTAPAAFAASGGSGSSNDPD